MPKYSPSPHQKSSTPYSFKIFWYFGSWWRDCKLTKKYAPIRTPSSIPLGILAGWINAPGNDRPLHEKSTRTNPHQPIRSSTWTPFPLSILTEADLGKNIFTKPRKQKTVKYQRFLLQPGQNKRRVECRGEMESSLPEKIHQQKIEKSINTDPYHYSMNIYKLPCYDLWKKEDSYSWLALSNSNCKIITQGQKATALQGPSSWNLSSSHLLLSIFAFPSHPWAYDGIRPQLEAHRELNQFSQLIYSSLSLLCV